MNIILERCLKLIVLELKNIRLSIEIAEYLNDRTLELNNIRKEETDEKGRYNGRNI